MDTLNFDKDDTTEKQDKESVLNNGAGQMDICMAKSMNLDPYIIPYTKIYLQYHRSKFER
jgi:hypothetical protein